VAVVAVAREERLVETVGQVYLLFPLPHQIIPAQPRVRQQSQLAVQTQ
jgi:hypothetical protein